MSHDQKPGRVRLLADGGAGQQRRRGDASPVVIDGSAALVGETRAAGKTTASDGILLALLFVIGCAAGGAGYVGLGL